MASALGLTQGWYSKIERGETTPDVLLAQRIASYFGTSVSALWPDVGGAEVST